MQNASQICLLASREAKGGSGMVATAGQYLNLVLSDLKLNRNLKVNRVTQIVNVNAGTYGPFNLELDYLRTYDMSYPLQGPNGMTQFLVPITMEQWDAEFKTGATANYPYEFATDLSTQAQLASLGLSNANNVGMLTAVTITKAGYGYGPSAPVVTVAGGGGSGAAVTVAMACIGLKGTFAGYSTGDILTATGGTFTRPIIFQLAGGGVFDILDPGSYSIVPGYQDQFGLSQGVPLGVTGGSGVGGTFFPAMSVVTPTITNPGTSPYTSTPTITLPSTGFGTATATATIGSMVGAGQFYIYPQSNGTIPLTHRYMKNQPDLLNPETSNANPWFAYDDYLIVATAARMMGQTGDDRQQAYESKAENMLRPYLIMEGDEQEAVKSVKLDPRHFKSNRGLRPTKVNPY